MSRKDSGQPEGVAAESTPSKQGHDDHAQSSAQHGATATDHTTPTPARDHHTQLSAENENDTREIPGRRPRTYPGTLPTWRVNEQH